MANEETINFMKVRTGSMDIVMPGDEVNQTLTLTNRSEYEISDIYIKDMFSDGITFKENSLQVNGVSAAGVNPTSGFKMTGTIPAGNSATVTYRILIDDDVTQSRFSVVSEITYTANGVEHVENSTTYNMDLATGELSVQTDPSVDAVLKGEKFSYVSIVKNTGNLKQMQVTFKNPIPSGVEYVDGSLSLDGEIVQGADPEVGVSLGMINPSESKIVMFDVEVK